MGVRLSCTRCGPSWASADTRPRPLWLLCLLALGTTLRPALLRFGSFGCSVNLPLGSRSADPHSTAVGVEACSTPVLNRAQRGCVSCCAALHPMEYSLLQPRSAPGDARGGERGRPRPARRSPVPFLHGDALLPACVRPLCLHTTAPVDRQRVCLRWLGHHPFSELHASAGELLHIPQRVPTFMATVLLSRASNILCGI